MTNGQGVMRLGLVCGVALLVSCSGDKHGSFISNNSDGGTSPIGNRAGADNAGGRASGGAGGSSAAGQAGNAGQGGGSDTTSPMAPAIEITAPAAVTDPNAGPVLVDGQVTVLCTVTKSAVAGAKSVDPSTVKIALLGADGASLKSVAGVPTNNDSEYSATFVLTAVPSGNLSFRCSADDTATPVHSGVATVETFVDQGPDITIVDPPDKSAHNLLGPMNIEFEVAPAPITDGDKQAAVSSVTLLVGGVEIDAVEKTKGHYQASVNFSDKTLFNTPPSGGVPIVINASNSRKKLGKASRTLSYGISIDGVGPVLTFGAPAVLAVTGRASVLTFSATDVGSGVDRATVGVKLNDELKLFSATDSQWTWDETSGAYSFKIGAALAKNASDTQVTVALQASDKAGNASSGTTRVYNLDNQPPIVDLDPPDVYEVRPGTQSNTTQCSDLFDPLGPYKPGDNATNGSPNDQATVVNYGRFRSLVWDTTNHNTGAGETFMAGTDRDSVRLYIQTNTDAPLLADDDKDGVCDEIWTGSIPHQLQPTDKPLPFVKLLALAPTPLASPVWGGPNAPNFADCMPGLPVSFSPLCSSPGFSDMSVVIRHSAQTSVAEPVIYAVEPDSNPASPVCTGIKWEISTAITAAEGEAKLGWVCIAVRAVDSVGNPGISPPLRVCLDDGTNPDRCKDIPPPSCTDNCTPPPHFPGGIVRNN